MTASHLPGSPHIRMCVQPPCDAPNPPPLAPSLPVDRFPRLQKSHFSPPAWHAMCMYIPTANHISSNRTTMNFFPPPIHSLGRAFFFSFFPRPPARAFQIPIAEPRADGGCRFEGGVQRGEGLVTEVGVGSWERESRVGAGMACMWEGGSVV